MKHFLIRAYAVMAFATLWLLQSCGGSGSISDQGNLANQYKQSGATLSPLVSLHHLNEDSSRIDFQIDRSQLLYMKGSSDKKFKATVEIEYHLLDNTRNILDSGRVMIVDLKMANDKGLIRSSIVVYRPQRSDVDHIELFFRDVNRRFETKVISQFHGDSPNSRQFFEWRKTNGDLQFGNYLTDTGDFRISYLPKDTLLLVRYYNREFPIAIPPYARLSDESFDFTPDSIFLISTLDTLQLNETGIYHFQLDTSQNLGFTLFRFEEGFPNVLNSRQLIHPMRYITTKKEFARMQKPSTADSAKREVDAFWLDAAGSIERGQELVANYFGRVEMANRNFSSYIEGWKTDRGVMYIIYGPPTEVYRSAEGETWVYGDRNSVLSYTFNFVKVNNPFSENDYALNRLSEYRYGWGQAVGAWRNGRTYGVKDIQREQNARDAQLRQQRTAPTIWY